jgi:betaine-aldehyde dehydrogenase
LAARLLGLAKRERTASVNVLAAPSQRNLGQMAPGKPAEENKVNAQPFWTQYSGKHFIDGSFVAGAAPKALDVIDPATEERLGQIAEATAAEIDDVVAIANAAQKRWNKTSMLHRAELLHEVAADIRATRAPLAELLTREMGKPFKESMDEAHWASTAVDYYAEVGRHEAGKVLGPAVEGQFHFTTKDPLGVVVLVLPFNYPLCLLCWQAAAAIAAGNAVIIKPSELTSLTTLKFMESFRYLPKGVVQVVTGSGRVGQQLVEHQDTHMVAFTGGIETGRRVAEACARQYKRVLLETSGNDPFIVMPSAPLDIAARGAVFGAYLNCGQVCAASERFYVHEAVHDDFVAKVIEQTARVRIGNGLDRVDMGPLASLAQRDRYEKVIAQATAQGGQVRIGGGRPAGFNKGYFVDATVITGVEPEHEVVNDESFGPVLPVVKVPDFETALTLANRSRYALGSTIYTLDLTETMRAVNELEAGMVWVNAPLLDNDAGPFGGRKQSGMGRQLGAEGLDTFRHTKFTMIDPAATAHDFWWFPYADKEAYQGRR